jgi:uncharacterized protein (TIGR02145 family)
METRKIFAAIILVLVVSANAFSQNIGVAINSDGAAPNNCAILDVSSTSKAFLPPRMTNAQKVAITTPAAGLMVWCSNCGPSGELQIFNGTTWTNTSGGTANNATTVTAPATALSQIPGIAINTDGSTPHTSAMLDVSSTSKGFLPPRMTNAQKSALAMPLAGMIIWCSDCGTLGELQIYNGTSWTNFVGGAASAGKPDAPTIGTAAVSGVSGTATVTFTTPASNGGSAITSYTATSTPGGLTGTLSQAGGGTITVTGLTNGTAYTFTVTATTMAGTGVASASSNPVTPFSVPGAPTIGTATAGNTQATVTFTAPASNGGSAITSYTATSTPGNLTGTLSQAGSGTITITRLTNGTTYTFTVKANNAVGAGAASAASNLATPCSVPGAMTIGTATAGSGQATITFTAPASNGGSAITSYTATSTPGGLTGTLSQSGSGTITVTGLTNITRYTFTVKANNAAGSGAASAASNSVMPYGVAGAPTNVTATAGAGQARVSFTAPASNGGTAITSYTATSSSGNFTGTLKQAGSGTITVTGLTIGTAYTFTVKANNAAGASAASAASNSVTPFLGAPTGSAAQSFCAGASPTVANLVATGTAISWFSTNTGGTALAGTKALVTATHYYASQTVGGTASATRLDVTVTLVAAPAAPVAATPTPSTTQIAWKWNASTGATGYKWSLTNVYSNATDLGNVLTKTETGLTCNRSYTRYVWAYNSTGCSSSPTTLSRSTSACPVPIKDASGNSYPTIAIGTQTWMAKNLNTSKYSDGTNIPNIKDGDAWYNATSGAWCDYDNTTSNSTTYGKLYNWFAVDNNSATKMKSNGGKNICPTGWHIPSDNDWTILADYLGGEYEAGGKLKESGNTHWPYSNEESTNSYGFTALPGGACGTGGSFYDIGTAAMWWSSTEYCYDSDCQYALYRYLIMWEPNMSSSDNDKTRGYAVRCLKD